MSAKTDESGVENSLWLNYFRFLGPIAEWEKKVGSMDLVRLSGGLLVKIQKRVIKSRYLNDMMVLRRQNTFLSIPPLKLSGS